MARKSGRPTISDVARLAGVSPAIASRALSAEKRPVSDEKKARVEEAAKALRYRPNPMARALTKNTLNLVAVVVNNIRDLSDLDLFDPLIGSIQTIGKQVVLVKLGDVRGIEEFLKNGIAFHVDAVVIFSDFADAATARNLFQTDQIMMLNGRHDANSPAIIPTEMTGIDEAVADAAKKGVKSAVLVTGRITSALEQRRAAAYVYAFKQNVIELVSEVQGDYSYDSARDAIARLLVSEPLPDAVFCTSDAMAMGVLDEIRATTGKDAPSDFRLYGFDNLLSINLDSYPIASIGFDKTEYIERITAYLKSPKDFDISKGPQSISSRYLPNKTAS